MTNKEFLLFHEAIIDSVENNNLLQSELLKLEIIIKLTTHFQKILYRLPAFATWVDSVNNIIDIKTDGEDVSTFITPLRKVFGNLLSELRGL